MKRIVLGVQYDGAPWLGWQTQSHGVTVQDRLQHALTQLAGHVVTVYCAGRTDRGVHALEQVVHFDTTACRPLSAWVRGVNSLLPSSIAVRWATEVAPVVAPNQAFHARYSARSRTYYYVLYNHPVRSPLLMGKVGWVFRPLHVDTMCEAASYLLGEHDFSAFRAVDCQAKSPVKEMYAVEIEKKGAIVTVKFHASAFLHHMVRNIMGCLVAVGVGSRPPDWMQRVLLSCNRRHAAPTFVPDGLYLAKIDYDTKWGLPQEPIILGDF